MIRKLQAVVLDCADPVGLAQFYAELLGGRMVADPEDSGWVEVHGFEGTPLACQRVDGYRPPDWPGQGHPQQLHLDFDVDDLEGRRHGRSLSVRVSWSGRISSALGPTGGFTRIRPATRSASASTELAAASGTGWSEWQR